MKIVTFGEIMLRLQPYGYKRIMQADAFEAVYGGGEANVSVSLSQLGADTAFFTRLPENVLADKCIKELRGWGVDTSRILRGGDRIGIYFCEKGAGVRASNVIYDRAHSAISQITPDMVDEDKVLAGAGWLHFTGITPALGENVAQTTLKLVKAAKKRGMTVSCDLNYRAKLWSREEAGKTMRELLRYVDVLISNEEDCKDVLGLTAEGSDITGGHLSASAYAQLGERVTAMFPNIGYAAFTLRESISASRNNWSAVLVHGKKAYISKKYNLDIVDRVGGGDSFGAGLIYALSSGRSAQEAVELAVAASAIKHTVEGDFNVLSLKEAEKLMGGDASGRVQR